jgi:hypothetical protein
MGEFETVRLLLQGRSIARFGDGELKILEGRGYVREAVNGPLSEEMRGIVRKPHRNCIVAIPTMNPAGPKFEGWQRHVERFCRYVSHDDGNGYGSAFITRPDSAADPIESPEYFALLSQLWAGRERVAVMSESKNKLLTCVRAMAASVHHVECPRYGAYAYIDDLQRQILNHRPTIALLSCGPTATCLANRLAAKGVQALDLGSIGGMLMRLMQHEATA